MRPDNAEQQLQKFLETAPPCVRDMFRVGSMSPAEKAKWRSEFYFWRMLCDPQYQHRLEVLLKQCPEKWNEYVRRREELAKSILPRRIQGRPRKDRLAQEGCELSQAGLSYAQVSKKLNQRYGPGTTNPQAIRQLIRSRRSLSVPKDLP
jgi:hypothetical protein